jgi:hypothetical protein
MANCEENSKNIIMQFITRVTIDSFNANLKDILSGSKFSIKGKTSFLNNIDLTNVILSTGLVSCANGCVGDTTNSFTRGGMEPPYKETCERKLFGLFCTKYKYHCNNNKGDCDGKCYENCSPGYMPLQTDCTKCGRIINNCFGTPISISLGFLKGFENVQIVEDTVKLSLSDKKINIQGKIHINSLTLSEIKAWSHIGSFSIPCRSDWKTNVPKTFLKSVDDIRIYNIFGDVNFVIPLITSNKKTIVDFSKSQSKVDNFSFSLSNTTDFLTPLLTLISEFIGKILNEYIKLPPTMLQNNKNMSVPFDTSKYFSLRKNNFIKYSL